MEKKITSKKIDLDFEYKKIIDECAKNRENFIIYNGSPAHAAYLISKFFEYADKCVRIFSGRLYEGVYGREEIKKSALKFLSKDGTTLEIIVQDSDFSEKLSQHPLLKVLVKSLKRQVEDKVKIWDASRVNVEGLRHFALMDDKAYRLETDHEKRKAIANFGDAETAKILYEVFELLKQVSRFVPFYGTI